MEQFKHILEQLALYIDLFGIFIVLYGFTLSAFALLKFEVERLKNNKGIMECQHIRVQLGTYILLGIEFMIASDIIHTVLTRELIDLAFVSALVAIRTAISFFLGREISELKNLQSR
ncbi:MAG: putative membrane protein [Cellvibrionaceae bacterium]|jgi:uncharacterized membrane protein